MVASLLPQLVRALPPHVCRLCHVEGPTRYVHLRHELPGSGGAHGPGRPHVTTVYGHLCRACIEQQARLWLAALRWPSPQLARLDSLYWALNNAWLWLSSVRLPRVRGVPLRLSEAESALLQRTHAGMDYGTAPSGEALVRRLADEAALPRLAAAMFLLALADSVAE